MSWSINGFIDPNYDRPCADWPYNPSDPYWCYSDYDYGPYYYGSWWGGGGRRHEGIRQGTRTGVRTGGVRTGGGARGGHTGGGGRGGHR